LKHALDLVTILHVACGTVVLAVAPAALLVRKGGRWHRNWGLAFAGAMALVIATAAFMWQPYGHAFLLFLDVLCAYLVFSGYRTILRRRRKSKDALADGIDLTAAALVLGSAAALVILGLTAQTPLMRSIALVLFALAAIGASFAGLDMKSVLVRTHSRIGWLLSHFSAMIAAYISAVTAFCVINFHGVPMTLRWLVPSVAGSLVITAFSIQHRLRARRQAQIVGDGQRRVVRKPLVAIDRSGTNERRELG
jgi:hypothetical protein